MTPLQLNVLCNIHCSSTGFSFAEIAKSLTENGLILLNDTGHYICTAKGAAHVRQLCLLELPKEAWVGANGNLIKI